MTATATATAHEAPSESSAAELYSVPEVARIFGLAESVLKYWIQTGLLTPAVRRGGRFFYTFRDLLRVKAAADLGETGLPLARLRELLDALAARIAEAGGELAAQRIVSDGAQIALITDGAPRPATIEPVLTAFSVQGVAARTARATGRYAEPAGAGAAPQSGYEHFLRGAAAEDEGDLEAAEASYAEAAALEPGLAAAHANLGVLRYRRGDREGARGALERALEIDPELPEARFNYANLAADEGEVDVAIAELRRVCTRHPDYPDAHYNLAVLLARVGGFGQARGHLERYLACAPTGAWAARAEAFLRGLPAA